MPRGDGTGPAGMGSMTGRGLGYCAGLSAPGYMNACPGYGFGRRRGFRAFRGYGRGYYDPAPAIPYHPYYNRPDPEMEKKFLVHRTNLLKKQLSNLENRLAALNDRQEKKDE